jgi:hypothetical protein
MMEQEKMLQDMLSLSQLAGAPGLDPAMLSALAANPFLLGALGAAHNNNFTAPAMPSPHRSANEGKQRPKQRATQRNRRSPSPKERERSVSPASSVASNVSYQQQQQQQQQQPDFNMLMQMMAAGGAGMMPPGLGAMGLGALGELAFISKLCHAL